MVVIAEKTRKNGERINGEETIEWGKRSFIAKWKGDMLFQKGNSKLDSVSLDKIEIENKQTNKKVPLKNYSASKILSIPSIYFDCCLSKLHNKTSTM